MSDSFPTVTVVFAARERFALAAKALRQIRRNTDVPYTLMIIDANTPARYRGAMEKEVAGMNNVRWLRTGRFTRTFENMNIAREKTTTEFLAFIENDCLAQKGWLRSMLATAEQTGAGVVAPQLWEGPLWRHKIHHDYGFSDIRLTERDGRSVGEVICNPAMISARAYFKVPTRVNTIETHCLLFRRSALEKIGTLDTRISSSNYADISFLLLEQNIPVFIDPNGQVCHHPTRFINRTERAYFFYRWDMEASRRSVQIVSAKWQTKIPDSYDFVIGQRRRTNPVKYQIYRAGKLIRLIRQRLSPVRPFESS